MPNHTVGATAGQGLQAMVKALGNGIKIFGKGKVAEGFGVVSGLAQTTF
jgi:hypothetical protein